MIKAYLTKFSQVIPIAWDRFTESQDYFCIYGWIARRDGKRDFIVLELGPEKKRGKNKGTRAIKNFVTSSAKYSLAMYSFIYGSEEGHVPCQKIAALLDK